jgi:hypothetical protein
MRTTALLALIVALLAFAAPARGAPWRRPVDGPVARAFAYGLDPFRRGWHRGVDLAAAPGTTVRAACAGTVVTSRAVAVAGGVVTLRCGRWRVTHLPLVAIAVRRGAAVAAGARLGRLGASPDHSGLHLGVRQAGNRFGYVDPMRFLGGDGRLPPPLITVAPRRGRLGPAPPSALAPSGARAPAPSTGRATAPSAAPAIAPSAAERPSTAPAAAPTAAAVPQVLAVPAGVATATRPNAVGPRVRALAPWPAWAGLALLLSGVIGGGVRVGWRRRARAAARAGVAEGVA